MKKIILITLLIISCLQFPINASNIYDARIGEKEILTPPPAAAPQINGPELYGVRPGKKFIYRIPCQGNRPLKFQAIGLPESMTLDTDNGIITGTAPTQKGEYPVIFKAANNSGTTERNFRIVVGDKIALTPPTGYNSWGGHMLHVSDKIMRKVADTFINKGLADVGFQYICIDDGWTSMDPDVYLTDLELLAKYATSHFDSEKALKYVKNSLKKLDDTYDFDSHVGPTRDESGRIISNKAFPDMKALADYIHSYGLKAGLYSGPGQVTCQCREASFGHEELDAKTWAQWGYDMLKYDLCGAKFLLDEWLKEHTYQELWALMAKYLQEQDRDILYNLCQYGQENPWQWAPALDIQTWRISGDLNLRLREYFFSEGVRIATQLREYNQSGQWNDPDYMYIHKIRDGKHKMKPSHEIPLTTNQRYQYVTMWSIVCAPFFFSCDINEIDDFTLGLLCNAEIVNTNQDELVHVAEVVRDNDKEIIMVKKLADGSKVLALFNRQDDSENDINLTWQEANISGQTKVRDIWRQKEIGTYPEGITVKLSPGGCAALRVHK